MPCLGTLASSLLMLLLSRFGDWWHIHGFVLLRVMLDELMLKRKCIHDSDISVDQSSLA